jgi:thioredoxin-related protein
MKTSFLLLFNKSLILFVFMLGLNTNLAADFENNTHAEYPEWFVDSPFLDLAEVNQDATENGKKGLMVLFTTRGCSYCEQFIRRSLGDAKIAAKVQKDFSSVGLEIFDDAEMVAPDGSTLAVKHFAKKEGVGFAPTLLFYDKDGKMVLRQVGYQAPERFVQLMKYTANQHYREQSLRDFLATILENSTEDKSYTQLKADALFDGAPYSLDRSKFAANEPLMVIFEKPGCAECKDFHQDVLTLKDVRSTLQKFQVVRLDPTDDKTPVLLPDGKRITPSQWFDKTTFSRLPALLFFDEGGNQVLKTDALVLHERMMNSLNYVLEKAYKKDWTYQQFARSKALAASLKND